MYCTKLWTAKVFNSKTFTTSDGRNLAMCAANNRASLYFIEQVNAAESKIHTLSTSATTFAD